MDSQLVKDWSSKNLSPSKDFDFFTRRDNIVVGKLKGQEAQAEYICPYCKFHEIKNIKMEKSGKKFKRPRFKCSKCGKTIIVSSLKKKN